MRDDVIFISNKRPSVVATDDFASSFFSGDALLPSALAHMRHLSISGQHTATRACVRGGAHPPPRRLATLPRPVLSLDIRAWSPALCAAVPRPRPRVFHLRSLRRSAGASDTPSAWLNAAYSSQNRPEAGILCKRRAVAPREKPSTPSEAQMSAAERA
eukprot:scaffold13758_cov120-Isochrysis_galbana.AAC.4